MPELPQTIPEIEAIAEAAIAEANATTAARAAEQAVEAAATAQAIAQDRASQAIAEAKVEASEVITETRFDITVLQEGMTWLRAQVETLVAGQALLSDQVLVILTGLSSSPPATEAPREDSNGLMTENLPDVSPAVPPEAEAKPAEAEAEAKPEPKRRKRPKY